jgi:hypothetical protein
VIEGKLVRLRAPERGDLPTFVKWINDPEVTEFLKLEPPISMPIEPTGTQVTRPLCATRKSAGQGAVLTSATAPGCAGSGCCACKANNFPSPLPATPTVRPGMS